MEYKQIKHRGEKRLLLLFTFDAKANQKVKQLPTALWSQQLRGWHIQASHEVFSAFIQQFPEARPANTDKPALQMTNNPAPQNHEQRPQGKRLDITQLVKGRLRLRFMFDKPLTELLKTLPFALYNKHQRCWDIADSDKTRSRLKQFCQMHNWEITFSSQVVKTRIKPRLQPYQVPNYRPCPEIYRDRMIYGRYSGKSIDNYCSLFEEFINYYSTKNPADITEEEITAYMLYLVKERGISESYQNMAINAIKFYYEKVLGGKRKVYQLERPNREKKLPEVLSEKEVQAVFKATPNLKHRTMLMLCYSAGLRVGELLNLTPKDIDSGSMQVWIRGGKGKKDRFSLLSENVLIFLRKYYIEYRPSAYLFEGQFGGKYSARSIQLVLARSCERAEIKKHATMHTLRHSFGTHLLEHGTNLRYIQALLGHASSTTTEIYTHITTKGMEKIKSPLDTLGLDETLL